MRGAEPAEPAQRQFVFSQRPRLDPPGAARRDLVGEHVVKEPRDPRHAALRVARAPAPGDPQPAALFGSAKAGFRIAVELGDIGKPLQRGECHMRRRPLVKLAIDLGPILRGRRFAVI